LLPSSLDPIAPPPLDEPDANPSTEVVVEPEEPLAVMPAEPEAAPQLVADEMPLVESETAAEVIPSLEGIDDAQSLDDASLLPPLDQSVGSLDEQPAPPTPSPTPFRLPPALRTILAEVLETIVLTIIIYAVVNFATGRFRVEGNSMQPTMHPDEYVLVDKVSYMVGRPQRGDIVVFQYPLATETERDFIKRVIGLPGDTVSIHGGVVRVNGQPLTEPYISAPPLYDGTWTLNANQYFMLGDNRNSSSDSHSWGPLETKYLIGRAAFVYWPPEAWKSVPHHDYNASAEIE